MKNATKKLLAVPLLAAMMVDSQAAIVPFLGTVDPVCSIVVDQGGTMKSSIDGKVLGSKEGGGASGKVTVTSNTTNLSFNATAPSNFSSAPTGGNDDVTFVAEYEAIGVGSILGGILTPLVVGDREFDIDLTATKNSGTFPEGNYSADVTVTCE